MALVLWLAAGCQTARIEQPVLTEVALPEARPYAVSSGLIETNRLLATNLATPVVTACPPTNTVPQLPALPLPTSLFSERGWVSIDSWSTANSLGRARKIGLDKLAVSTPRGELVFHPGAQVVRWDGVSVWLGHPPRYIHGQACLHELDVRKTLDPLLRRPASMSKPGRVVVIDPGHGGADGGTQGSRQQLEKNLTLDWARRIREILQTNGWKVVLTRSNDTEVTLPERVAVAERAGADLFVSLHFNGLAGGNGHSGVETFCTTPSGLPSSVKRNMDDDVSLEFPNNAYDRENIQYAFRVHREVLAATRAADSGVRRARFMAVLRGQHRPAVLVEGGFLSNPEEAGRIATTSYRQKLAEAVARALE